LDRAVLQQRFPKLRRLSLNSFQEAQAQASAGNTFDIWLNIVQALGLAVSWSPSASPGLREVVLDFPSELTKQGKEILRDLQEKGLAITVRAQGMNCVQLFAQNLPILPPCSRFIMSAEDCRQRFCNSPVANLLKLRPKVQVQGD